MENKRLEEADIIVRNFRANSYLITKRFQNEWNVTKMKLGLFGIMVFIGILSMTYGVIKDNMDLVFYTCISFIPLKLLLDKFNYVQIRRFEKYKKDWEDLRYEYNTINK